MGMVITRKAGEAIRIGAALVTVVRLRNGRVKIDVAAPADVPVRPVERRESKSAPAQYRDAAGDAG